MRMQVLAQAAIAPQNPRMRPIPLLPLVAILLVLCMRDARADGALYRCESDAGISIQGTPCPKGSAQRKIAVQTPVNSAPASVQAAASTPASHPAQPPGMAAAAVPPTPPSAMRGPNDPYLLWTCMRADGSTFDSRTGVPGRQWVANPDQPDVGAKAPANVAIPANGEHLIRPIEETKIVDDAPVDNLAPPAGAPAGRWVADQCIQLDPQQACDRFATRRDALRKQIYAAKPSERSTFAPEEQDLTSMLNAACGGR